MRNFNNAMNFTDNTSTEFGNVNAIIEKINKLNTQRSEALRNIPNFAEYNDEERKVRTRSAREKVNSTHNGWLAEEKKKIETQQRILKTEINLKRHPETTVTALNNVGGQSEIKKMQAALDLSNAIGLLTLLKQKYPTAIVKDLFEQGKVELANTLIDVGLKIPTGTSEEQTDRSQFISVVNSINNSLGVTPLEFATAEYQDSLQTNPQNLITLAITENQLDAELDSTLAELER